MNKVKTVVRHKDSFTLVMDNGDMVSVVENEVMHGPKEGTTKYCFQASPEETIEGITGKLDIVLGMNYKGVDEIIEKFPDLYRRAKIEKIKEYQRSKIVIAKPGGVH